MSGLLESMQGSADSGPEQGQPESEQMVNATPEEQRIYEQYFKAAIGKVFEDPKLFGSLMKAIESIKQDAVTGLARLALSMYDNAEKQLGPLNDDDISEAVGEAIIEALLEMAVSAGVLTEEEVTEDTASAIYIKMAQQWIDQNPDRADPEDQQYLQQQSNQQPQQQAPQQQAQGAL